MAPKSIYIIVECMYICTSVEAFDLYSRMIFLLFWSVRVCNSRLNKSTHFIFILFYWGSNSGYLVKKVDFTIKLYYERIVLY